MSCTGTFNLVVLLVLVREAKRIVVVLCSSGFLSNCSDSCPS